MTERDGVGALDRAPRPGQYADAKTGLSYNRLRYSDRQRPHGVSRRTQLVR